MALACSLQPSYVSERIWSVACQNPRPPSCSLSDGKAREARHRHAERRLSLHGFGLALKSDHRLSSIVVSALVENGKQVKVKPEDDASKSPKKSFFQDQDAEGAEVTVMLQPEESFGSVLRILGSRVSVAEFDFESEEAEGEGPATILQTEYLIEWMDDHPDSWEPAENVAQDVKAEFEEPWWQAARKADDGKLTELLEQGRDPNAIDVNNRTALFFAAGMGSEKSVRLLVDAGADVHWQDKEGFTALHIAAGYVHTTIVKILLDYGADPELEDIKGRSALSLAQDLIERIPKNNPMMFARRLALDQVVKMLDEAIFEEVEVEKILDKRQTSNGQMEYLVSWSDGSEPSWESIENIADDVVRDFEEGLEYGIAESILEKRVTKGPKHRDVVEYLVKWADSEENSWEPEDNVAAEVVAEFEGISVKEVEKKRGRRNPEDDEEQ
eukprot:TRINITY_DN4896_c1_g1_i1.p1 TRINITY_DN4896_c1_g1~~TRINITY_DN4896_c1_g1_i1.p1  ORF type:complete len:442 (+),score=121.15 TRINITY_DN4896_c1_g1_i1:100-1425(+)